MGWFRQAVRSWSWVLLELLVQIDCFFGVLDEEAEHPHETSIVMSGGAHVKHSKTHVALTENQGSNLKHLM